MLTHDRTGITLPEWQFGKLANDISEREVTGKPIKGMGSNGTNGNSVKN